MSTPTSYAFPNYCGTGVNLSLWLADIVDCPHSADCLVNCCGSRFESTGGVSKSIVHACGAQSLQNEFANYLALYGSLGFGKVFKTSPFSLNRFRCLFHVVSPGNRTPNSSRILLDTFTRIFDETCCMGFTSVLAPFIGIRTADIRTARIGRLRDSF
jgi:O-acetyl-ADP-ribose deacetylase (regulator of RNase III)